MLSCAVTALHAQVVTPSPGKQTLDQQTPDVDQPGSSSSPISSEGITNTPNELGTSIGAFTLYPALEIDTGYDNNVFASSPATPSVGSAFAVIRPALELRSEWANHSLRVVANGGFGYYASAPTQNFRNYNVQVDGRLDIRYDFYLNAMAAFRRSTEALGTPNVSFAQSPTVVDSIPVQLSLYHKLNRLFYQLSASATRYKYYDYSTISDVGLPGTSRDRTEFEESIRVGYEVVEGLSFWVSPGFNQRTYVDTINSAGQQRDSSGWLFSVGSIVSLGPKSVLEGSIGRQSLTYLSDGSVTAATTFGLAGSWNGYGPLTVRPALSRSINESALSNYQNYISTTVGVDFIYDIHDAWKAVGGVAYNSAAYTPAVGVSGVNPRTDYFFKGAIGLLYELRPQFSIGPLYEYTQGWSSDVAAGGPSYSRSLFSIRLVVKR